VDVAFSGGPLAAGRCGGFTVDAPAGPVALAGAEVTGAASVRIVLAAPVEGPLTLSLGRGRSGAGALVPAQDSAWRLPAQTALHLPVAAGDLPSGGAP